MKSKKLIRACDVPNCFEVLRLASEISNRRGVLEKLEMFRMASGKALETFEWTKNWLKVTRNNSDTVEEAWE